MRPSARRLRSKSLMISRPNWRSSGLIGRSRGVLIAAPFMQALMLSSDRCCATGQIVRIHDSCRNGVDINDICAIRSCFETCVAAGGARIIDIVEFLLEAYGNGHATDVAL